MPRDFQREVIRSALVLKLHQYEDTGALLAATTTSLPEHPGSGRTWDYRYCWLRDAYFTLNALERLGHSDEMELFLVYLRNLAGDARRRAAPRLHDRGRATRRTSASSTTSSGYRGERPVRVGNQAFHHVQNDVYGEMILAVSRLLLDERFAGSVDAAAGGRPRRRSSSARSRHASMSRDAGLWEMRGVQRLHGFTLLMHWAGARRVGEIGEALGRGEPGGAGPGRGRSRRGAARRALLERRASAR